MYDIVIRGGTVVDGTGTAPFTADVGIADGRIVSVGRIRERAASTLDADGLCVAPGFIEGHCHFDAQLFWDPFATNSSYHGVTTAVMGNCGFTLAPCRPDAEGADLVIRSIERAEDISREDMAAGVPWRWGTFGDYLDAVDAAPKSMNYAGYVGHSALRTYVMGERAYTDLATDTDVAAMRQVLAESMRQGAIGFSTSRTTVHRTFAGDPVASYLADWDELRALVGVLGELGAGVFELAAGLSDPDIRDGLRTIAIESGRPVHVAVAQPLRGPQDQWRASLDFLDEVAAEGGRITGQAHVRQLSNVSGFRLTLPYDRLPRWSDLRARPLDEQLTVLRDERTRRDLVNEAMHWRYAEGDVVAEVGSRPPDYDHIFVLESATGTNPTVAEVAAARRCTPVDVLIDLSLDRRFDQFFLHVFGNRNLDDVLPVLKHPRTVVAGSDAGAHVSQVMESCATTYFLAHWVRDTGAFSLEEGVRLLTSGPAAEWGLTDRGQIAEGAAADVVMFDPATVAPDLPTVVHDLPSGGKRLVQRAQGIYGTVINGEVVAQDGEFSDARPGRLLRGPLYEERIVT